ncbi:outer membrane beta-barrel protein [Microbulbifer bruguierae]|uniref:Outer membrane beta-barrel protein n=1 Tax=Microbulbifer bruguierae TaxID=3029061 RepID=A0ABY8N9K9_9GAMM|nr:outer membrane beta-barrel protein [Microbulbifer bruguierae]WGL15585.1 outer membrane beta-barrel protein [Microbulbifer bruguierae]
MKSLIFLLALLASSTACAQWNNPIDGYCSGEYHVVGTLGLGVGELQINDERDFAGYASIGITPDAGVWQVELRYTNFDDGSVSVDQWGLIAKVDFTVTCDVQCLYWMVGWNYGEFDLDTIEKYDVLYTINDDDNDNYWNAGVGYRYNWTEDFNTSIEYNYNDIDTNLYVYDGVSDVRLDLGHLRTLTLNLSYRF